MGVRGPMFRVDSLGFRVLVEDLEFKVQVFRV